MIGKLLSIFEADEKVHYCDSLMKAHTFKN